MNKIMAVIGGLVILTVFLCHSGMANARSVETKATPFTATDLQAKAVHFGDYLGEGPVLLVFFATWCPPCQKEVGELIDIYNTYTDKGLQLVAVSVDNSGDVLPAFIEKKGIPYTVWHDQNGRIAQEYKVMGIPTNILISRDGVIQYRAHQPPSSKEIEKLLQ